MKMRNAIAVIAVFLMLAGCSGGTSSSDSSIGSTEEGVLLTGTIDTSDVSLSAAASSGSGEQECVDELCGVMAYGEDGSEVEGEIDPENMRWRIRLREGNWMLGCRNRNGEREGEISINGMTDITVEEGDEEEKAPTPFTPRLCLFTAAIRLLARLVTSIASAPSASAACIMLARSRSRSGWARPYYSVVYYSIFI